MIWWLRSCHYEYGEYQRVVHQCQQSREAENLMRRNSYEQLKKEQDILECCSAGILHMWVAWQSLIANSKLRDSFIRILLKKKNHIFFFCWSFIHYLPIFLKTCCTCGNLLEELHTFWGGWGVCITCIVSLIICWW